MLTLRNKNIKILLPAILIVVFIIASGPAFAKSKRSSSGKSRERRTKTRQVSKQTRKETNNPKSVQRAPKSAPRQEIVRPGNKPANRTRRNIRNTISRNTPTVNRKSFSQPKVKMKPKNRPSPAKPKVQQPRVIRKNPQRKTVITKNRTISYIPGPAPRKAKKIIKSNRPKVKIGRDIPVKKNVIVRRKEPVVRKAKRTDIDVRTTRRSRIVKRKTARIVKTAEPEIVRPRAVKAANLASGTVRDSSHHRRGVNRGRTAKHVHYHRDIHGRRPSRIYSRIIWPSYRYRVCYRHGPRFSFRYVRPHYHRKYVFISIGGWWPWHYRHVRYYWYGWHPYHWYGCYPTAYKVDGDTYNYYTYNYNTYESAPSQTGYSSTELSAVDHTTFADVREKLAQQEEEPEPQTLADQYFEEGVKAFEQGDYGPAIQNFADAMSLDQNDVILPFAYVQGLFADQQYAAAADELRKAVANMPPDQEGLFFPRGLYPDDEILFEQIEHLKQKAQTYHYDPDMQLLLGYQLLGIEKYDEAEETLQTANMYGVNFDSANVLLDLLEKLKTNQESD